MKKNTIMSMAGLAIAAAILILLMAATPASSGVELSLKELLENQEKHE